MVNYQNGKIYKIEPLCEHEEHEIYIGSSAKQYLSQRMDKHRSSYKGWKNGKSNKYMSFDLFDKYGSDNCQIVLIENYPCETRDQLTAREAYFINELPCINKYIPHRTMKQYHTDKKEVIKLQRANFYQENKARIQAKNSVKHRCLCGGIYTICHKAVHEKSKKHINAFKVLEDKV